MNSQLHVLSDGVGRPIGLHLSEGQRSDFKGADVLLSELPAAQVLIADRGYDSSRVRKMLADQNIESCIPRNRKEAIGYCKTSYKKRHKVENAFLHLKRWRGIATRYAKNRASFRAAVQIRCIALWASIS